MEFPKSYRLRPIFQFGWGTIEMHQSRRGVLGNREGFTLLEALFQLLVFSLFVQFVFLLYFLIHQWNETFLADEQIQWEIFIQDFQQYLLNVDKIYVMNHSLYIESAEQTIKINKISDVLRLQINEQGYVPLLIGIRNAEFSLSDQLIAVKVEFLNGRSRERTLFVQYAEK